MTDFKTACKMCGRELSVKVDPGYADLGDPYSLLPLATCNRCYDYRDSRRKVLTDLLKLCTRLIEANALEPTEKMPQGRIEQVRNALQESISIGFYKFAQVVCTYRRLEIPSWWKDCLTALQDHPAQASNALGTFMNNLGQGTRRSMPLNNA
jgi:hypothetical protein